MHRLLEKFSAFASTAVVFVYLIGLFASTASFFASKVLGISPLFAEVTAFGLAAAFETQSFLEQRLVRGHYQARHKLDSATPEWEAVDSQFRVHFWILVGLLAFSAYNSIHFWILLNNPQTASDWFGVILLGLAVPVGLLTAGFLTPLTHDASSVLANAEHAMLRKTVRTITKQQNRRVEQMRQRGVNLAPLGVKLLQNASETAAANRLSIINTALDEAEGLDTLPAQLHNSGQPLPAALMPHSTVPIGAWSDMDEDFSWTGEDNAERREQAATITPLSRTTRAASTGPKRSGNTAPRPRYKRETVLAWIDQYVASHKGKMPSNSAFVRQFGMSPSAASKYANIAMERYTLQLQA